jgi:hypothetical protein
VRDRINDEFADKEGVMCTDAPYEVLRVSEDGTRAYILGDDGTEKSVHLLRVDSNTVKPGMFIYARDRIVYSVISAEEAAKVLRVREIAGLPNPPSVRGNTRSPACLWGYRV